MNKPAKILLIGAIGAATVFLTGHVLLKRQETAIASLVESCLVEDEKARSATPNIKWDDAPLVCDPKAMARLDSPVGIQAKIAEAQNRATLYFEWLPLIAALILGLCALPFVWYFLLQRIRELREATIGK